MVRDFCRKRPFLLKLNRMFIPQLGLFAPLVFLADLGLFLGTKIVGYVERLADIFRSLALDHTRNRSAGKIKKRLDIHVVCSKDELEQNDLLNINKVGIPLLNNVRHLLRLEWFLNLSHWLLQMMLTEVNDFSEYLRANVGQRNLNLLVFVFIVLCSRA